jgi:hypothetical protein
MNMKKILITIAGILLISSQLAGAAFEKSAKSRSADVVLSSDKPLVVGNNELKLAVTLKNTESKIKEVEIKAFMPAMPGMPAMESKSKAVETGNGNYQSNINFSMGGTWQIHIFIVPEEGRKIRVKTSVNL